MYPINAKLDFHALLGPEGQQKHLFNPNHTVGGGGKWPTANLNDYFSATECPIDLKPSCIFKFVRCLEVYKKKMISLDLGGTLEGLLLARVPQNQPRRVNFRVHFGVHEGP